MCYVLLRVCYVLLRMCYVLLRVHPNRELIGTCNPMLCPIWCFRAYVRAAAGRELGVVDRGAVEQALRARADLARAVARRHGQP